MKPIAEEKSFLVRSTSEHNMNKDNKQPFLMIPEY